MARYRTSVETPRSREAAFDYMADFANVQEWDPSVTSAERLGDGAIGVGTEFRLGYRMLGSTRELRYRIVEYDRPHRVVLACETGPATIRDAIEVRETPGGARITYDATITPKGPLKLADPLLELVFRRAGDAAAAGLRRVMNG